jgi:3-oxoacyl-[acyl-carrier-protein] synthase II
VTRNQINVLVTGMGMTTPLGADVASTWRALLAGESRVSILDDEWAAGLPVRMASRACQEPAEVLTSAETRRLDRSQQFAVIAARQAWADAGTPDVDPERFAVVIGTGIGGGLTTIAQYDKITAHGAHRVSPFTIQMLMPNGAAAAVSLDLGAQGGAHAPMSACASGAEAIAAGLALLRSGRADIVIAGGTEACVGQLSMAAFARMGALSQRVHEPQAASRPFDAGRDGFVLAEGAAALVLERADTARARGARAHARLAGAGMTCDAHDMTMPHPGGQARAMKEAMATAGLGPADIGHVNAHATGTPAGDAVEATAVTDAIGNHPLVTATKSSTGHMIGGAGAVEAVFTVLSLRDGVIPPTRNLDTQAPDIKLNIVTGSPYREAVDAALSNSFGFGGHNVALALTTA